MSQHYSDPERAKDPHALPDVEVFYADNSDDWIDSDGERRPMEPGWYWWHCFPGCLPDSDPNGPFDSEEAAIADATGNFTNGDGPWDTDGQLPNENGESSEAENDAHARRHYRD